MEVFLSERGQLFRRVMPLAFRNLAIAQQRDIERYRLVRGGGWDRPKASFKPGDYVLLRDKERLSATPGSASHSASGGIAGLGSGGAGRE